MKNTILKSITGVAFIIVMIAGMGVDNYELFPTWFDIMIVISCAWIALFSYANMREVDA